MLFVRFEQFHTFIFSSHPACTLPDVTSDCRSNGNSLPYRMHPAWSKVKAWQHLLQHYDWVWQTDADMAIMDMHQRLETFIDSEYDVIIGRDCNVFHILLWKTMDTPLQRHRL